MAPAVEVPAAVDLVAVAPVVADPAVVDPAVADQVVADQVVADPAVVDPAVADPVVEVPAAAQAGDGVMARRQLTCGLELARAAARHLFLEWWPALRAELLAEGASRPKKNSSRFLAR